MSVINQVLSQLEQRGAHDAVAEQPMVRAVQNSRRNFVMPLLAGGLALLAGIAAWQWVSSRKPAVMAGGVALKAAHSPVAYELEKSAAEKLPVAPAAAPQADVPVVSYLAGSFKPASRLSMELGSIPPPPQQQAASPFATSGGSGQALSSETSSPAANPDVGRGKDPLAMPARQRSAPPSPAKEKAAVRAPTSAMPMKQVSSAQQADAEFRRAVELMQLGRIADALAGYEAALRLDVGHDAARQALVALLLEGKRNADAERVLLEGLNSKPEHIGLTMLLARLQVERGALDQATATLEKSLKFADAQADYRAFLAALLQRQNRNEEASKHYQIVLQHAPNNGIWLMGYGISLQALQRDAEAKEAFKRALDTKALTPELQVFVQQKLNGL